MRISDWSSDVCSSDLPSQVGRARLEAQRRVSPSAGGLHPIHLVCIKSEQSAAKLYEPSTHGFRVLQTDHARVHQANEREVSAVLGANRGCTEIERAPCRERGGKTVKISVGEGE